MPGLGVISSIPFTGTPLEQAFNAGLGAIPGLHRHQNQDNLGFDTAALNAAVGNLNNDNLVTLIVAVGGVVTEQAAVASMRNRDVISLVGGVVPGSPHPSAHGFRDRVNLESFRSNGARIAHLATMGIQPPEIALLYNPNSKMTDEEQRGQPWRQCVPADIAKTTAPADIARVYDNALASVTRRAVIVSADPSFFRTSPVLVDRANAWLDQDRNRYIVYPLKDYEDARPRRRQTSLCGPRLGGDGAYRRLGQLAAHYLVGTPKPALNLDQSCSALTGAGER